MSSPDGYYFVALDASVQSHSSEEEPHKWPVRIKFPVPGPFSTVQVSPSKRGFEAFHLRGNDRSARQLYQKR